MNIEGLIPPWAKPMAGNLYRVAQRRLKIEEFGAHIALTDVDMERILLVQNTYADTEIWRLVGGGLHFGAKHQAKVYKERSGNLLPEHFLEKAVEEAHGELGLTLEPKDCKPITQYWTRFNGYPDNVVVHHSYIDRDFRPVLKDGEVKPPKWFYLQYEDLARENVDPNILFKVLPKLELVRAGYNPS